MASLEPEARLAAVSGPFAREQLQPVEAEALQSRRGACLPEL